MCFVLFFRYPTSQIYGEDKTGVYIKVVLSREKRTTLKPVSIKKFRCEDVQVKSYYEIRYIKHLVEMRKRKKRKHRRSIRERIKRRVVSEK